MCVERCPLSKEATARPVSPSPCRQRFSPREQTGCEILAPKSAPGRREKSKARLYIGTRPGPGPGVVCCINSQTMPRGACKPTSSERQRGERHEERISAFVMIASAPTPKNPPGAAVLQDHFSFLAPGLAWPGLAWPAATMGYLVLAQHER